MPFEKEDTKSDDFEPIIVNSEQTAAEMTQNNSNDQVVNVDDEFKFDDDQEDDQQQEDDQKQEDDEFSNNTVLSDQDETETYEEKKKYYDLLVNIQNKIKDEDGVSRATG